MAGFTPYGTATAVAELGAELGAWEDPTVAELGAWEDPTTVKQQEQVRDPWEDPTTVKQQEQVLGAWEDPTTPCLVIPSRTPSCHDRST